MAWDDSDSDLQPGVADDSDMEDGADINVAADDNSDSDGGEADLDGFNGMAWDDEIGDDDGEADGPERNLIRFCVTLLLTRVFSARVFCSLMYYLGLCGLRLCGELGLRPDSNSGHFTRKVRRKLKLYGREGMYKIPVPGRSRRGLARMPREVLAYPPHEAVDRYIQEDPTRLEKCGQ